MGNPYPTRQELRKIATWETDGTDSWNDLLAYCKSIWWRGDLLFKRSARRSHSSLTGSRARLYHISTGGWSGNEDIIGALMKNHFFWAMCWQESQRGGHYIFRVPDLPVVTA